MMSLHPRWIVDARKLNQNLVLSETVFLNGWLSNTQLIDAVADGFNRLRSRRDSSDQPAPAASWRLPRNFQVPEIGVVFRQAVRRLWNEDQKSIPEEHL